MTQHRPLVIIDGQINQLPNGDTIAGASGGSGGSQEIFVQETEPAKTNGQPWQWYKTDASGNIIDLYVFNGVA